MQSIDEFILKIASPIERSFRLRHRRIVQIQFSHKTLSLERVGCAKDLP